MMADSAVSKTITKKLCRKIKLTIKEHHFMYVYFPIGNISAASSMQPYP